MATSRARRSERSVAPRGYRQQARHQVHRGRPAGAGRQTRILHAPPRSEGSRKTSAKLALARAPPVRGRQIALALLGTRGISHVLILPVWSDTASTAEYDARAPTAGDPVPSLRRGILPDLPLDRSASEGDRVALESVNVDLKFDPVKRRHTPAVLDRDRLARRKRVECENAADLTVRH